ncbi:MAG: galactokinase [Candidatus Aminicenantes bacterium]|nr:galactokinase [Candidatus Aminicenantes bacterium]
MIHKIINTVSNQFRNRFKTKPLLVRSPGRVNLIGEHTDYNEGFVLPTAIDKSIIFAVSPNKDRLYRIYSIDMDEYREFIAGSLKKSSAHWANYLLGVIDQVNKMGFEVPGFDCVFGGDIPIGAGLSSSAAIEAGLAFCVNEMFQLHIDKLDLVKLSQRAENEFVGVKCGIMDQFTNIFGAPNKVMKLDCRSLEYEYFPFDFKDIYIVLYDTRVSHSLASSEYNIRRAQCEQGVAYLKNHNPRIQSLRDVTSGFLESLKDQMDPVIYKRCHYVVKENERLLAACDDLKNKELGSFGKKMVQTHEGLKSEYEVSCRELDFLVEHTLNEKAVFGSRMMGGGFGGCTINLIKEDDLDRVNQRVKNAYLSEFGKEPGIYTIKIEKGTHII